MFNENNKIMEKTVNITQNNMKLGMRKLQIKMTELKDLVYEIKPLLKGFIRGK